MKCLGLEKEDLTRLSLEELEKVHIKRVLDSVGGHKMKAAEILKVDRRTLYRKLQSYNL